MVRKCLHSTPVYASGTHLVRIWYASGTHLVLIWYASGTLGTHMIRIWYVSGTHMVRMPNFRMIRIWYACDTHVYVTCVNKHSIYAVYACYACLRMELFADACGPAGRRRMDGLPDLLLLLRSASPCGPAGRRRTDGFPHLLLPRQPGRASGILYTCTGSGKIVCTGTYRYIPVHTGTFQYRIP